MKSHTNLKFFGEFMQMNSTRLFGVILFLLFLCSKSFAQGPNIVYTPLANNCVEGTRTLVATITDVDGVPTSGTGLPVLYYNFNNSVVYNAVTGVSIGNNQYQFTFGAGAVVGFVVGYYIVAQDNTGLTSNCSVSPSAGASGFSINPPAVTTVPTSPNFYVIQPTLTAGNYLVGAGQTYTTITDAINAYNNSCLNGPVSFLLTDAAYGSNETFPISINNPQASATNTLTIKPNTAITTTITGNSAEALFKINGADYVIFDGSNAGNTVRSMTIQNTSIIPTSVVFWLSSFNNTNGATYNTIKNCNIYASGPNTSFACVAISSGVMVSGTSDAPNTNNSLINNDINNSFYAVYINGAISGENSNVISGNTLGSSITTRKTGYRGLFLSNQNNVNVSANKILGVNSTFYSGAEADATAAIVVSGSCTGGVISGNNIYDIKNTSNSGAAVYGISLQTTNTASGLKVYNNFIHTIVGYGKPNSIYENGMGIAIISGGGYGIYYNSIHLGTNQTMPGVTACLYVGVSASGANDVRNNIFSNRQTIGVRYALYNSLARNIFSIINYNDYFSNGYLGYLNDPIGNLAGWQAATLSDGNSVAVDPIFVLPNGAVTAVDLHLQNASTLNDQAVSISGITVDYDGVTRSATTPDIGADEFTPPNCTTNFGGVASAISSNIVCLSGQAVLICSGFDYGAGMSYQWESSTDNFATAGVPIVGETNPTTANPPTITVSTYFRLRVRCGSGGFGYSNSVLITVKNPQITSTIPASRCGNGSLTLTANCNAGTTVQWYTESVGGAPIATGTTYTTPIINATQTFYAEPAFIGNSGSCGPASPAAVSNAISYQYTPWDVYFDVLQATTLATVDVYPNNPGDAFKIEIFNSSNTLVGSANFVTSVSGGATAQVVPVNIFLLPGNDYYISIHTDDPIYPMATGLSRNVSGASYPYTSSDINITGNGYLQSFYMCLYNWKFNNGCTVSRVPVTATIGTPSDFTISGVTSICSGNSTTLSASSTNSSYTYTWSPISTTGSSVIVSPTTNTRYTVTAFDGTCTNVKTIDITVSEAPTPITINSNAGTPLCNASVVTLTAVGGNIPSMVTIFNEKFEGNGLPVGWDTSNINPQAAYTIAGKWTQRRSTYVYGSNGFKSNDSSKFFMANSSATGSSLLNTSLKTPRLDFTGYDSASLTFWHHYSPYLSPDSIIIEKSKTPNATEAGWRLGTVYKAGLFTSDGTAIGGSLGTTLNFVQKVINLKPFLTPTSSRDTFYLRFRYVGKGGYWWAIDNVKIEGRGGSPITWSPSTGLYDNVACTNAYNPLVYASVVYTKPTAPVTYTAISGTPNGCSQTASITLTPRAAISTSMSGSTTICPGGNANINIAFTGIAPWKFVIKNVTTGTTTALLTANTSPYVYNTGPLNTNSVFKVFSMKDSNNLGCSPPASALLADSVKITISSLKARITGLNTICPGSSANLSVSLTGTPPWRLQYLSGGTPVVLNGITTNPYTITVSPTTTTTYTLDSLRDNTGCTALRDSLLGSAVVTVIPTSTAILSGSSSICPGSSATISTALTGTPPWNITYTNGVTPITYSGIATSPHIISVTPASSPTTYSILAVTDGNGCTTPATSISGSAVITTSPTITGSLTGNSTICQSGVASLTATLTGTSPWKITYTQNGGSPVTITNITASPYVFSVTPGVNTTYALTSVIDGNLCSASSSNLSSNASVTINRVKAILSGTTTICPGSSANLTVTLSGTPPWRLQYLSGSTPVVLNGITSNPYTISVSPSTTTTYTLDSLRDNIGCAALRDSLLGLAVVTVIPASTAVLNGNSAICQGTSATISTTLTGTPPWNITYTNGVTPITFTGVMSSPHVISVTPVSSPATYSITAITDGNGCTTPSSSILGTAVITTNPIVTGSLTGTSTICQSGTASLTATLTGTAPWKITYTQNGGASVTISNITTSPYVFSVSPGVNTTYALTSVIDGNLCSAPSTNLSSNAVVTINRVKAILSGTTTICPGTLANLTVNLTGTPPWRLQYLVGNTPVLINGITSNPYIFTVSPSVTTTYTLDSLRDNTGCTAKRDSLQGSAVVAIIPSSTAVTSGSSTICSGSSASISTTLTGTPPWNITYTNGGTPITYTGVNSSPHIISVTPSNTPTTYSISTLTDGNGCSTPSTSILGSATITTNPTVTGSLTGTNTICEFGTAMLSVNLTGSPPWKFAYTENGTNTYVINNVTTSPYVFFVSPVVNTTYVLNSIIDGNGCNASPANLSSDAVITISTSTTTRWNGYSDDWFDINNWCGTFPDETTDVIIPSGTPFSPVIFGSEAFVRNLTINDGATMTINADGAISVTGNSEINGTLINNGRYTLNGSEDQVFPGGASSTGSILKMNVLEINKLTGKVFFKRKFPITDTGVLKITNAFYVIIIDTITFTSGISGTSRIDVIPENVIIDYLDNGCISVERFIPAGLTHGKSWQLLSVPTFGQTIKQAWQEGAASVNENPVPGYGTTITSNLPDATTSLGFDFYTPIGPSIKIYDDLQNNYSSVSTTEELIANPKGYMLLVRGDRSVLSGTAPANPVILRTTGKMYYGSAEYAPIALPVQSDGFQCAGNPYPSPIDFQSVLTTSTTINPVFYVWDPTLQGAYGLGGFQTISSLNDWKPIPGGTFNYNADSSYSLIQSGQAFFTYSSSGGTINFAEINKVSGQKTVMRNHSNHLQKTMRLQLFDAANKLVDGNVVAIDSNSLDGINEDDALKLNNFGENAAVKNQNRLFSLEVRSHLTANDTIQYYLTNMRQQSYKISFLPYGLENTDVIPFLVDSYARTEMQLSLNDTSFYSFQITNNPSTKNPERFKIIFKRLSVLPIGFIEVSAKINSGKGNVVWKISAESGIQKYQIEKSTDGISFVKIGTINAMGNDGNLHRYSFTDLNLNVGNNFYRIRSISNLGVNQLSNIARIWVEQTKPSISVSPNPIENNTIDLTLHHFVSGNYLVQLYNSLGQFLLQEEIKHDGQPLSNYLIKLPKISFSKGNYLLKIIFQDAHQITTKVSVR